jgi:two-component system alkaline phosphatase synthesis response regulator PhoP
MSPAKILVADDEPDVVETIRFRLEQEGYDVVTCANGLEALGAARSARPDLIVLDVMMPGENGYRVAKLIREDEAAGVYEHRTPIILLTARNLKFDPEREKMFMDFSQADLPAPFDLEELVTRIAALLAA